jgi:hypothetical protein
MTDFKIAVLVLAMMNTAAHSADACGYAAEAPT